jgi:urea transporter
LRIYKATQLVLKEAKMANVGSLDRTLRFIAGAVLLASPFLPPFAAVFVAWGAWKFAVAAIVGVMIGTAVFRFGPAYTFLGIRTCPIRKT